VVFDVTGKTMKTTVEVKSQEEIDNWWNALLEEGKALKAGEAARHKLSGQDLENLAQQAFTNVAARALNAGYRVEEEWKLRLIGELSGMGMLLTLIARPDVEDIAVNLQQVYIYTTSGGWEYVSPAQEGNGDALRVLIDRAGQRSPTPDYPIADAMLQVMVPSADGTVRRKGVRVNYIMPPASPYGDIITLRISNYRSFAEVEHGSLSFLTQNRLPPIPRPRFVPRDFPRGSGVLTPEAANYLLSIMVRGGTLVVAGATGSGKTYLAGRILQEMLDFFPKGAIRLFIIEDSNEIVLNGWDGDPDSDTGNVLYTVTRPEVKGGPPPVPMYDLIRAALRSRPHGVVIGEARGAEAWELIRAAATGHGHSAFTIHATGAEHVWPRFLQVVQSHPDVLRMTELQIAQSFADAVTAVIYIERSPAYGQVIHEIHEVSQIVERVASRPSFSALFRYDPHKGALLPTGNRPMRPGFMPADLGIPESYFQRRQD
jgi:type IV secretory pathway ATPase VirB11/archaellum biosynthesis ATPase